MARCAWNWTIARPQADLEVTAAASFAGRPAASATGPANGARATALLSIDEPRLWSPQSPNLYDVTLELRRGGTLLDRVHSYFGFRTVAAEHGKVLLNGDPIFLKMVLDQGYWPESILTPPTDEAIQYDIRMAKEMGFNGARKHQKLEDPRYLYWADRMGFLVSSEMANAYEFDDAYVERFTREWTAAVERDYNHPSIIIWAPINESWGVPDLRDPRQQNHLKSLYALTHSLDATRLVDRQRGLGAHRHDGSFRHTRLRAHGRTALRALQGPGQTRRRSSGQWQGRAASGLPVQWLAGGADGVRRHRVHPARPRCAAGSLGLFGRGEDGGCARSSGCAGSIAPSPAFPALPVCATRS